MIRGREAFLINKKLSLTQEITIKQLPLPTAHSSKSRLGIYFIIYLVYEYFFTKNVMEVESFCFPLIPEEMFSSLTQASFLLVSQAPVSSHRLGSGRDIHTLHEDNEKKRGTS